MATGDIVGNIKNGTGGFDEVTLQASSSDLLTGTDNTKLATAKNLKDAEFIAVHIGTSAPANTTILWLDTN